MEDFLCVVHAEEFVDAKDLAAEDVVEQDVVVKDIATDAFSILISDQIFWSLFYTPVKSNFGVYSPVADDFS